MDTVLDSPFIVVGAEYDLEDPIEKASQWIKEGGILRPSGNLSTQNKLKPGIYKVEANREYGIYCKKIEIKSDQLFTFSNSIINDLLEEINVFWEKRDLYKKNNLIHKRGILLEGYPGTGKSSIISMLSSEIIKRKGIVFKVSSPNNLNLYVEFVVNNFRIIEPNTPIISIIEDIDKYEEVDDLLDFLDGKLSIDHHVVVATSNNTKNIPDSFLRPSRLDLKIEIPLPSELTRKEYFNKKNVPEKDVEELVDLSKDLSLADLKEIYTSIYLLDYTIVDAIEKIKLPRTKKNYNSRKKAKAKFGI